MEWVVGSILLGGYFLSSQFSAFAVTSVVCTIMSVKLDMGVLIVQFERLAHQVVAGWSLTI